MGHSRVEDIDRLLPLIADWIVYEEARIQRVGIPLNESQIADAVQLGVSAPERVRVEYPSRIPLPWHADVLALGQRLGLEGPGVTGRSFRYALVIRWDLQGDREQLVHELAHTVQYERFGAIEAFLRQYLLEVSEFGYPHAPLEQEAIAAAARVCATRPSSLPPGPHASPRERS